MVCQFVRYKNNSHYTHLMQLKLISFPDHCQTVIYKPENIFYTQFYY